MSAAVSAQYVTPCPTCGAQSYEPCRTRKTRRVTDTHAARIDAQTAHIGALVRAGLRAWGATQGDVC